MANGALNRIKYFSNPRPAQQGVRDTYDVMSGALGGELPSVMDDRARRMYDRGELGGLGLSALDAATGLGALKSAALLPLMGVIKNKGGNWLTGSVENALKGLKSGLLDNGEVLIKQGLITPEAAAARPDVIVNRWIEGPLTKYIKTQMATPEDPVRLLAERRSGEVDNILTVAQKEAAKQLKFAEKLKAEGPKPGMPPGTWETAVERAERNAQRIMEDAQAAAEVQRTGILHFAPEWVAEADQARRKADGFVRTPGLNSPGSRLGKTKPAQDWEDLTDYAVNQSAAEDMLRYMGINPEFAAKNMWLQRVDSGSPVYDIPDISTNELGFDHLTDELRNALNPESGLPANLLLRPDQLSQMGMEKAVAHVGDINRWRASQKIAADQELANKASLVREYAENNPKGLRWVELGKDTPDLEKQLKHEGDTMRHCVGGYCPDVLEGRSRIFSLRDAKGEPHVTVEARPPQQARTDMDISYFMNHVYPKDATNSLFAKIISEGKGIEELGPAVKSLPEYQEWVKGVDPVDIAQIKGKQNKAPNPEYLPFVQDFVKNSPIGGKWGTVGDLGNAGLYRPGDADFMTKEDLFKIHSDVNHPLWKEVNDILQSEIDNYRHGGVVRGRPGR